LQIRLVVVGGLPLDELVEMGFLTAVLGQCLLVALLQLVELGVVAHQVPLYLDRGVPRKSTEVLPGRLLVPLPVNLQLNALLVVPLSHYLVTGNAINAVPSVFSSAAGGLLFGVLRFLLRALWLLKLVLHNGWHRLALLQLALNGLSL
jgi:hypothetical protein